MYLFTYLGIGILYAHSKDLKALHQSESWHEGIYSENSIADSFMKLLVPPQLY